MDKATIQLFHISVYPFCIQSGLSITLKFLFLTLSMFDTLSPKMWHQCLQSLPRWETTVFLPALHLKYRWAVALPLLPWISQAFLQVPGEAGGSRYLSSRSWWVGQPEAKRLETYPAGQSWKKMVPDPGYQGLRALPGFVAIPLLGTDRVN